MERECEGCETVFTDKRYFNGELPKNAFCPLCCTERFFADVEYGNKTSKSKTWKFRSGWKVKTFNTSSLYEESSDFFHADINKGKLQLEISIKKREGSNDEFLVWIGGKQFLCKAEPKNPEAKCGIGTIVSEHTPFEILDEEI